MTTTIKVPNAFDSEKIVTVNQETVDKQARDYDHVLKMAAEAGLISQSSGGITVIIHPHIQIKEGIYHRIQVMAGRQDRS